MPGLLVPVRAQKRAQAQGFTKKLYLRNDFDPKKTAIIGRKEVEEYPIRDKIMRSSSKGRVRTNHRRN